MDKNLRALESKDEGTCVSDDFLAELFLHKCGLSRSEQKDIFEKAGGEWDPEKIKSAILTYYDQAHEPDESRILNSRGYRNNPKGINFVQHNPTAGIEGTDLSPDMVEEYDPHQDLDTTNDTFNPAYATYRIDTDNPEDDPSTVLFTNSPYDDDYGDEDFEVEEHEENPDE